MRLLITVFSIFTLLTSAVRAQTTEVSGNTILYVYGTHGSMAKLRTLEESLQKNGVSIDDVSVSDFESPEDALEKFNQYDLVILDDVNARQSKTSFSEYIPIIDNVTGKILAINWLDEARLTKSLSVDEAQALNQYFDNGGEINLTRMGDYIALSVLGDGTQEVQPPIIYPGQGFYAPGYDGLIFNDIESYVNWRDEDLGDKPVIGVMMQRGLIESVSTNIIDETVARIEEKGALAVPFFFEISPGAEDYVPMLQKNEETFLDLIINFSAIHFANERKSEFEQLGVPVLQSLTYMSGDQAAWEADAQGISPGMTPFFLVLPESAGVIDPVIVAAVNRERSEMEVIDYQMEHLLSRAIKYAKLRSTPNAEKKLTVMVWGSRDIGASFMNVEQSLRAISGGLNKDGYSIDAVDADYFTDPVHRILDPFYRDYQLDELLKDDLAELMPVQDYLDWLNTLPEDVTQPINEFWGPAEENFMVVDYEGTSHFVLPRIRNGNMLVMRQPPRSDDKDENRLVYHRGTIPMNHYYLAAYYYAREFWGSDAIIHLGTHGSQEYLAGKERGLSHYDESNLAVWDVPVFYPFIVDDVGEAMQTKRRGSATVISHMTPPFAAAGLTDASADIHELMHQYKSMDEGGVREKTGAEIKTRCFEDNFCEDLGLDEAAIDADFDGFLEQLHTYLDEIAGENQPLGLHSFGELSEERLVTSTIVQMLGPDFASRARKAERKRYGTSDHNHDHDHSHDGDHDHDHVHAHEGSDQLVEEHLGEDEADIEDQAGFKTVRDFVVNGQNTSGLSDELIADIERGREYYTNMVGIQELPNLIAALSGKYISVKTGGDPIRHPESLPTGTNLYGFDPSRLPTKAAWDQGVELVEGVIEDYRVKHGKYPDKLAFSLWSIEAMRHYGVLESQALYAMGVRPLWTPDGRVIGTEIIEARELKRPRVDVVLSATGLYRDAFPNVMLWLAEAVKKIAELKEDNNSIWENTQRVKDELLAAGMSDEDAEYFSTVRIFSNASGDYASGIDNAVMASDTWETDAKIADNYMYKMGKAYGADPARWASDLGDINLYGKQLSGTDIALFSRSSNIYGMLSTDDPFEYFGGLSLAIRNLDGKSPEMMISNLRDANNPRAENAAVFLSKELRTRSLHKRWVSEMMEEGYSGSTALASRITNFWGWQVVDPNLVRDDQWQALADVYVNDSLDLDINEWFEKINPGAQARLVERMLEAIRKEYWEASDETIAMLTERLIALVNEYDLLVENQKLADFVNGQALGFGLQAALPIPQPTEVASAAPPEAAQAQEVEGQQLQKVEQVETDNSNYDWPLIVASFLGACFLVAGAARQVQQGKVTQASS